VKLVIEFGFGFRMRLKVCDPVWPGLGHLFDAPCLSLDIAFSSFGNLPSADLWHAQKSVLSQGITRP